jgi:hypothetical protein
MFGPGKFCLLVLAGGSNPLIWLNIPANGGSFSVPGGYDQFSVTLSTAGSDWYWPGRNGFTLAGFRFRDGWLWLNEPLALSKAGEQTELTIPQTFQLRQNFPNPFNSSTTIYYSTASYGRVKLSVFDLLGHELVVLVDGEELAGEHEAIFISDLPSGVYFYRLETAGSILTKRMTLTR